MTAPQAASMDELTRHLDVLATNLQLLGLTVRPVARSRHPGLKVINPAVQQLSETIFAARSSDGTAWFWWSWGERIDALGNEPAVAQRIVRVLS